MMKKRKRMPLKNFIKRNGRMLVGGTIIAVLIIMALFAPMIATHDPDAYDYTNRFALPSGLTAQDVLAIRVDDAEIAVHLSAHFAARLRTLSPREERAAVYAMVNTLTENTGAQSVRFFFAGEQIEALSGELEMRGTFLRNPGMVVE